MQPDPVSLRGQTGGSVDSQDCGLVPTAPSQVLQIAERINYMRLSLDVPGGGNPTLLVEGPDGRFCAIADRISGSAPELSGVWLPGEYKIYVGDIDGANNPYRLSISQQR
ncbi:hypothetical protein [Rubidibacter lacunae]|nr:hypothetical protein [Rubidibacter lacunae]